MTWLQVCGLCASIPGVVGAILLGACAGGATGGGGPDDERAIRELDAAWSRALTARDLDAVMTYYADEAVFLAPNTPIVRGKAAIRARFAGRLMLPGYTASFAPTAITIARSGDMAYEIGAYQVVIDDAGRSRTTTGKHLVTWEKRDGAWRVTAESINPDHPPG